MNAETGVENRTTTRRLPIWDNARFLAVTLVIVGHAIQRLTYDSDAAYTIYVAIYAFHIPLFLLISGYFSKSTPPTIRSMTGLITDLIIPYLILETAWTLVKFMISGNFAFDPTRPSWTLWFLLSLATFRVILPYLAMVRWPLTISLAVSIGAGYLSGVGSTFSLARTLGFLPFFVLGWKLSNTNLSEWWLTQGKKVWWFRAVAVLLFTVTIAVVYTNATSLRGAKATAWLYFKHSYGELGADSFLAGAIRLGIIAIALILSAAFLSLVPRRATIFTALGTATLYVYLLHTFALYPLRESGILANVEVVAPWIVLLIAGSVVLAFLLSSAPVRRVFRPVIQPRPRWLLSASALEEKKIIT